MSMGLSRSRGSSDDLARADGSVGADAASARRRMGRARHSRDRQAARNGRRAFDARAASAGVRCRDRFRRRRTSRSSTPRKAIAMFEKVRVPILGLVENMSYFLCPHCGERSDIFGHGGARDEALRRGVPFLGEVPLKTEIRERSDAGEPVAARDGPGGGPVHGDRNRGARGPRRREAPGTAPRQGMRARWITRRRSGEPKRLQSCIKPGEPIVLVNIWDSASAAAVAKAGAKALATSSVAVAQAQGFDDGEQLAAPSPHGDCCTHRPPPMIFRSRSIPKPVMGVAPRSRRDRASARRHRRDRNEPRRPGDR